MKLPDDILTRIQESVQVRRSPLDSNFNFIHQEDVFIIAQLAFQRGKEYAAEELGTIDKQTTNSSSTKLADSLEQTVVHLQNGEVTRPIRIINEVISQLRAG